MIDNKPPKKNRFKCVIRSKTYQKRGRDKVGCVMHAAMQKESEELIVRFKSRGDASK